MALCFLCQNVVSPGGGKEGDEVGVAKKFLALAKQLGGDGGFGRSKMKGEGMESCQRCWVKMKKSVEGKGQVDRVEKRVRRKQRELLEELRLLKKSVEQWTSSLEGIVEVAKEDVGGGKRKDSWRRALLKGIRALLAFQNDLSQRICMEVPSNLSPTRKITDNEDLVVVMKIKEELNEEETDRDQWNCEGDNSDEEYFPEVGLGVPYSEGSEGEEEGSSSWRCTKRKMTKITVEPDLEPILQEGIDVEVSKKKGKTGTTKRPVECPECHKPIDKYYLQEHIDRQHKNKVKCDECEKWVPPEKMEEHKAKDCGISDKEPQNVVKCPTCGKECQGERGLRIHGPSCNRRNNSESNWLETRVKCDKCTRDFWAPDQESLEVHQRAFHEREVEKPCKFCGRTVKGRSYRNHLVFYCAAKPKTKQVVCDQCGRTMSSNHELQKHLKFTCPVAVKVKANFQCKLCGKEGFTTEKNLKKHLKIHEIAGKREFVCDLCGAEFTQHAHLYKHKKRCKGSTPRKPRGCTTIFNPVMEVKEQHLNTRD